MVEQLTFIRHSKLNISNKLVEAFAMPNEMTIAHRVSNATDDLKKTITVFSVFNHSA